MSTRIVSRAIPLLLLLALIGDYAGIAPSKGCVATINIIEGQDRHFIGQASLATDLNGDGVVNILDIAIVAKAFESKSEDPDWNGKADLDKNGVVNIIDVCMVAKDYDRYNEYYVHGELVVGFCDYVTEEQVDSLIKSFGLSWESYFPTTFSMWVEVLSGSPDDYIDDLEASAIVLWARRSGDSILVQFDTGATEETAQELIDSFGTLKVSSTDAAPKWGVVKVPCGEELDWIGILESQDIVTYAELDHIWRAL